MSGNEEYAAVTVYGGEKVSEPAENPTRDGSVFAAWMIGNDPYDFNEPVYEDITLHARFEDDHYHNGILFTAWTSDDSLPTEPGHYYLTKDVSLGDQYSLYDGKVSLCLNGHTITKSNGGRMLYISGGEDSRKPEFTLYDCSDNGSGKLTGCTGDDGVVYVEMYGKFTMNGGCIADNASKAINALYYSTVIMNGGSITRNSPPPGSNNNAAGISSYLSNVEINGGTISNNTNRGVYLDYGTNLVMSGGTITGNITDNDYITKGAGIYVNRDAYSFKLAGNKKIEISGNTIGGKENNLYLLRGKSIAFDSDCTMTEDSLIGVSIPNNLAGDETFAFTDPLGNHGTISNFKADSRDYKIRANEEDRAELYLLEKYKIDYDLDGGSLELDELNPTEYNIRCDDITLINPVREHYEFLGWTGTDLQGHEKTVTIQAGSTGDRSYKANWEPVVYKITYNLDGGTLPEGKENPASYTVESDKFKLENPEKTGYEFVGWIGTDLDGETKEVFVEKGSSGNKTYTAVFNDKCPDGHTWVMTSSTPPTCEEPGEKNYTCSVCGAQYTKTIRNLTHDREFIGWEWIGNEINGYREATAHYKCKNCDDEIKRTITTLTTEVIDPTCTEGGKTIYKVRIDWTKAPDNTPRTDTKEARITEPLGHDYKDVAGTAASLFSEKSRNSCLD